MAFLLDEDKTIAVLQYICNKLDGCDMYKLLKIIYFAEKKHLSRWGRPITGDNFIAFDHGPAPSFSYDVVKGKHEKSRLFKKLNNHIQSLTNADLDQLSESDIECLDESIEEHKDYGFGKLKRISHDEAYNSVSLKSSISYFKMAAANGASESMIMYLKSLSENQNLDLNVPSHTR